MAVEFYNFSIKVKDAIEEKSIAVLHEISGEMVSQTARNSRVGEVPGRTKGSWNYFINEEKLESKVGSPLENAIWEEFGTGEYALHNDGRKGGWSYQDTKGNWQHTMGKTPNRALWKAFNKSKSTTESTAESIFGEL